MPRDYKVYILDIIDAVSRIEKYTRGISKTKLLKDPKTMDAVIRNLLVMGEATKNLPLSWRRKHPNVE